MPLDKIFNQSFILASKSPRRQQLLKEAGLNFMVRIKDVDETFPDHLKREEVACYLSEKKAKIFINELSDHDILITADTIVCVDDLIINKPEDYNDAVRILNLLSGRKHVVITGVTILHKKEMQTFHVKTDVYFKQLKKEEIEYYLNNYKPYDKAGAYGVQDWIGLIAIARIDGSYHNVMGLPVKELFERLEEMIGG